MAISKNAADAQARRLARHLGAGWRGRVIEFADADRWEIMAVSACRRWKVSRTRYTKGRYVAHLGPGDAEGGYIHSSNMMQTPRAALRNVRQIVAQQAKDMLTLLEKPPVALRDGRR